MKNNILKETKIWNKNQRKNIYVDFFGRFNYSGKGKAYLNISCDNVFTAHINKKLAGFGACQNFKNHKKYYTFEISSLLKKENEIVISVWHQGEDTQTYIADKPYLMFNVISSGKKLLVSDKNILCAENLQYKSGKIKTITPQLGFSYCFDNTAKKYKEIINASKTGKGKAYLNDTENLILKGKAPIKISEIQDGFLSDMGKERVGYLSFFVESKKEQKVLICYGERLVNGRVVRKIGNRDFSFEIKLKKGLNDYTNLFRRIAGRYIEILGNDLNVKYLGIKETEYPVVEIKKRFKDKLLQNIYDTSVYTLKCCMHEHYEDCPWREQALYNMDSRNQMICGYYAFKGHDYQRANLVLMKHGLLKSGVLNICFPSGRELPIPSFNLAYIIQLGEYVKYTKDYSILKEVKGTVKSIIKAFKKRIDKTWLIPNFEFPFWNFYEWSDYSANESEIERKKGDKYTVQYDLIINCMFVYAMEFYDKMFNKKTDLSKMKSAIKETFYSKKKGLYKLSTAYEKYSVLGNSFALLIGLGDKKLAEKLKKDKTLIPITLSMNTFFYDALLKIDKSNKEFIIKDILKKYKKMLDIGATTFWETEKGADDFDGAGSLCHGWSSMPVYYFNKLNVK